MRVKNHKTFFKLMETDPIATPKKLGFIWHFDLSKNTNWVVKRDFFFTQKLMNATY